MGKIEAGVVVLNYKDYRSTMACIESLNKIESLKYIVVVDNNSPNDSYEILKDVCERHDCIFLKADENNGYSAGNNIGIRYLLSHTDVDVIGIVNPDVLFKNDFFENVTNAFDLHKDYVILTGVQYKTDGNISSRAFWKRTDRTTAIVSNLFFVSKIYRSFHENSRDYIKRKLKKNVDIVNVPVVEGCCFFIRREYFEEFGLLDEKMFLFYEEEIIAANILHSNWKIGVLPNCLFLHNHSTTLKSVYSSIQMDKLLFKSKGLFYKNYLSRSYFDQFLYNLSAYIYMLEYIILIPIRWLKYHMMNKRDGI